MNIPIGGCIAEAKKKKWALHPIAWAAAQPCAHVTDEAFEHVGGKIVDGIAALQGRIDAVYLDLHGAMVTESPKDGEGEMLRRVRAVVGRVIPVVASRQEERREGKECVRRVEYRGPLYLANKTRNICRDQD